jgi:excisionase family DNA binding protein|tara:strand:+ start:1086 stop:1304 length:219 start_codon:yes stop_codon:yes gene_type:complete
MSTLKEADYESIASRYFLNRKQASVYIGVSVRHMDNLVKRGEITYSKCGSRIIIRRDHLDDYVQRNTVQRDA